VTAVAVGLHGRVAVALTGIGDDLGVVARATVRTRESQPYHDAVDLSLQDAERLIAGAAEDAATRATDDLRSFVERLAADGLDATVAGVMAKQYRLPATLEAILRSHTSCHAAEGRMTVDALLEACERLDLPIVAVPDLVVDPRVEPIGKLVGPPWRKEQKLAASAALRALEVG
jgi:hypothetical protein